MIVTQTKLLYIFQDITVSLMKTERLVQTPPIHPSLEPLTAVHVSHALLATGATNQVRLIWQSHYLTFPYPEDSPRDLEVFHTF